MIIRRLVQLLRFRKRTVNGIQDSKTEVQMVTRCSLGKASCWGGIDWLKRSYGDKDSLISYQL